MDLRSLSTLAWKHTLSSVGEEVYLKTGVDYTKPISFFGLVNERCNVKCRYCEYWRLKEYHEMSIDEWKRALLSIKDFVGKYSISFSGGEPFIKPGFVDLLIWCHENGISSGATTNGSALTRRNAAKVVAAHPFNVSISVDAPTAEVHDYLRGAPGLFDRLSKGIRNLVEERERQGVKFPIIIKPTVNVKNFRYLPDLVEWAKQIGASCIYPQPMDKWTQETIDELWIEGKDLPELEAVMDRLIDMAGNGEPILTPPNILKLIPDHFREKKAPKETLPCRVGTRNFFIRPTGSVELCHHGYPPVGNLREQTARDIWYSPKAQEVRRQTVECEQLCLVTCLSQKTLKDKFKMATRLLNARGTPSGKTSRGAIVTQPAE
jgi:MoaA/NifB/PqqE/SkfB family radical SAM enzyme